MVFRLGILIVLCVFAIPALFVNAEEQPANRFTFRTYYRTEDRGHHVPKRRLEELVIRGYS